MLHIISTKPFGKVETVGKRNGSDGSHDDDSDSDSDSLATQYGYSMNEHPVLPTENEPLLFRPQVCRQKLADADPDHASPKSKVSRHNNYTTTKVIPKVVVLTRVRIVLVLSIFILLCLVCGIIDYLNSIHNTTIHNTTIVYGTIGMYLFLIYYLINVFWYGIFTIIHIFLVSTHLFYAINRINYVECIVLNYRHFYYNYLIKLLFVSAIIVSVILNMNYTITTIPLYYTIIIIELVLSTLLYLCINKIVNNYDFIKNMHLNSTRPGTDSTLYTEQIYSV